MPIRHEVVLVEEATTHAVADTLAELAEIHDSTVGHVLAGEVSDTFDDSTGAGVANCKAIACFTFDEHSSTGAPKSAKLPINTFPPASLEPPPGLRTAITPPLMLFPTPSLHVPVCSRCMPSLQNAPNDRPADPVVRTRTLPGAR